MGTKYAYIPEIKGGVVFSDPSLDRMIQSAEESKGNGRRFLPGRKRTLGDLNADLRFLKNSICFFLEIAYIVCYNANRQERNDLSIWAKRTPRSGYYGGVLLCCCCQGSTSSHLQI